MQNLAQALQQSLSPNPAERRQAERDLDARKQQPGFPQFVLELAQSGDAPLPVRQAAALLFKNYIRAGWPVVRALISPLSNAGRRAVQAPRQLTGASVPGYGRIHAGR
jgi:exportin-2 (importin alpha re-exporter)